MHLGCPSHPTSVYSGLRLFRVRLRLNKFLISMSGYWKFNTLLFAEKEFPDQLLLILMWELTGSVVGHE